MTGGGRVGYREDVEAGARAAFGRCEVTRDEVIAFATRCDPQPFHLSDEAATPFDRLAASGWHTCAMTMAMLVARLKDGSGKPGLPGASTSYAGCGRSIAATRCAAKPTC